MFKIYTEWVQSQLDQSISNQINVNQCIQILYNHMNIITIKYIQNHTVQSITYNTYTISKHGQSYTFNTFIMRIQWQSLKDSNGFLGQSTATLGFICNYTWYYIIMPTVSCDVLWHQCHLLQAGQGQL